MKISRGTAFCEEVANKQGCYYNNSNLVFSFSIDDTHNHFNIPHLLQLLEYAKKNNKILILNSHKTVDKVSGDYQTKNATLEYICKYEYIHFSRFRKATLNRLYKRTIAPLTSFEMFFLYITNKNPRSIFK